MTTEMMGSVRHFLLAWGVHLGRSVGRPGDVMQGVKQLIFVWMSTLLRLTPPAAADWLLQAEEFLLKASTPTAADEWTEPRGGCSDRCVLIGCWINPGGPWGPWGAAEQRCRVVFVWVSLQPSRLAATQQLYLLRCWTPPHHNGSPPPLPSPPPPPPPVTTTDSDQGLRNDLFTSVYLPFEANVRAAAPQTLACAAWDHPILHPIMTLRELISIS